jgi:N-acetylmuramoyl-L-alanine amidase
MSRLLISSAWLLLSIVIFPGLSASSETLSLTRQLGLRVKSIYIDPWYGGKELGPRLSENKYSKEVTLLIAKKLKTLLEASGFIVYLSRPDDQFLPVEKRTVQARQKGADIHLKIKINKGKKNCIDIFILSTMRTKQTIDAKTSEELGQEIDRIVSDLKADDKYEESLMIAGTIAKKLNSSDSSDCIQLLRNFDYVLLNTPMPVVSVEFNVSPTPKKQPYVLDTSFQDKVAQSLADAVIEYAAERAPKMNQ